MRAKVISGIGTKQTLSGWRRCPLPGVKRASSLPRPPGRLRRASPGRPAQIRSWRLPTRPTKQSHSRAVTFFGESVELDAVDPGRLRDLVRRELTLYARDQAAGA